MSDLVDLHLHSTYSDGIMTPSELVKEAAAVGLRAIAVADHDNVDGIPEALKAGASRAVEIVTAVELSVIWEDLEDIHLLGYDFNPFNDRLQDALVEFRAFRASRNRRILEKVNERLRKQGQSTIVIDNVNAAAGGTIGRPHIGRALMDAGHVRDMDQAFEDYLVPCNVAKRYFPISDAIELIHDAGGCAVLAHPHFIRVDGQRMQAILDTFQIMGLDGLEAYAGGADNQTVDRFITLARRRQMVVTGGSDFHQPDNGGVVIGFGRGNLKIPYRCVEEIREAAAKYK